MTASVADAVRSCLDWARSANPPRPVDPRFLTRLLTVHGSVRSDPGDWDVDDVTRVTLTLSASGPVPDDFRQTWLTWCDHLVARGLLGPAESPRRLRAAVESAALLPRQQLGALGPEGVGSPWWDELWEPEELPRVHLPPAAQSAPAARSCPRLEQALRLASWVGAGLPLADDTEHETLTEGAREEAAAHLGLPAERIPLLFETALRAGFLRATYTEARPGPAAQIWEDDARVVRSWAEALPAMVSPHGILGLRVLGELFTSGGVWTVPELTEALAPWSDAAEADRTAATVETLARLGAVEAAPGSGVRITALGDHAMAHRWWRWGITLPGYPPTSGMSARELLFHLWEGRPVDTARLGRRWMTERGVRTGARELLKVCAELGAWRQRVDVFRLFRGLEPELGTVLDGYRDHPVLGGWVAHARQVPGRVRLEQLVVVLLDTYALRIEVGSPLPADAPLWRDPEAVTGMMWRSGHPATDSVLGAIALGALGPYPARAARRARFTTSGTHR